MGNEASTSRLLHNLEELEQELERDQVSKSNQPLKVQHGWDSKDCSNNMTVLDDGLKVRRNKSLQPRTDAVRGKRGYGQGIHIWKIHWPQSMRGSNAVIGVATYQAPLTCTGYSSLIGSNDQSMGWDIVRNVLLFNDCVIRKYPDDAPGEFVAPDVITVILNMDSGTLGFKSDGKNYGVALKGLRLLGKKLYPAISTTYDNCEVGIEYIRSTDQGRPQAKPCPLASPLKFKQQCGENIELSNDSIQAERSNFMSESDKAVVLTSRSLQPNEKFEIRVKRTLDKWPEGLAIGVVALEAGFEIPRSLPGQATDIAWVWKGTDVLHDQKTERKMDFNLNSAKIGDKFGVMRKEDGALHFFYNGRDMGMAATNVPQKIHGIVDVHGSTIHVELVEQIREETTEPTGAAFTGISRIDRVFEKMRQTIDLLKKKDERSIRSTIHMVHEHLYMLYAKHKARNLRQLMGDKLVQLNAAFHITEYIKFLCECGIENDKIHELLRTVCLNYSDASLQFARSIGQTDLLGILSAELAKYQNRYMSEEGKKDIVMSAFGILHNCSKVTENRGVYYRLGVINIAVPYTKPGNDETVAMTALMTLSYLVTIDQNHLIQAEPSAIANILKKLDEALKNAATHQSDGSLTFHAYEIVESLINLSKSAQNRVTTVQKGGIPLFVKMMKVGNPQEQELALNAVWELINGGDGTLSTISRTAGLLDAVKALKSSKVETVRQAAERISLKLDTQSQMFSQRFDPAPKPKCTYNDICNKFVETLNLHKSYFDAKYHRCYCNVCHNDRGDKLYYTRGNPPKDYGIPIGWYRYALCLPPKAKAMNVLDNWHRAFHGTKKDVVTKILEVGELLIPGDVALGGDKISEREGHFKDDNKPEGFDTKKIFVSPSIRYAGHGAYAMPHKFVVSGKTYVARVALQVCIRPGSYDVGDQTIGETKPIDPKFDNQEIEWSTKERGSTILYGLLVKLEEQAS
ncbi:neuralized-like protein 4 [Lingula anatina]|uniref:Neuralized-like protein 4 n=1 Tax=Lingula anatina TaxID=7574 RepID=A0A1S3HTM3_LINAN|nr:neuralized-like protein 4 [Lingula anatina]|eukprot:XP_013389395.1 neuralized-like protein 4 [Lingula anatina]